jgi:hypothetical protein
MCGCTGTNPARQTASANEVVHGVPSSTGSWMGSTTRLSPSSRTTFAPELGMTVLTNSARSPIPKSTAVHFPRERASRPLARHGSTREWIERCARCRGGVAPGS